MKIFDISQEVFGCRVFPGDPVPEKRELMRMEEGSLYNLSEFSMCCHNGTHVDAPAHFIRDGKTIEELDTECFVGMAYVAECSGDITGDNARDILVKAEEADREAAKRILIKGDAVVTEAAAEIFADAGIYLLGNESQTVGPENAPMEVHLKLLGAEVVLLEGIRLRSVEEGVYLLNAAPLKLGGAEGSPCRAVLIKED